MFTGIVEEIGSLISITKSASSAKIKIAATTILNDIKIGDSVACNGACLTVVDYDKTFFQADISYETFNLTALKNLIPKDEINLERALRLSDRLGGHLMSGHVDAVSGIISIKKEDEAYRIHIHVNPDIRRFIAKKGSISVDGISLTVADVNEKYFEVAVIPHTFMTTTLHNKKANDIVNIEVDMLARYMESLMTDKITADKDKRLIELLKEY